MPSPPPRNTSTNSRASRFRAATNTSTPTSSHILHRPLTGRVGRSRSISALSLSIRNQRAIWETATGRHWQPQSVDPNSEHQQSLPEYITPLSLNLETPQPAASSAANLSPIEAIPAIEDLVDLIGQPSASEAEADREGLSSMEFMMPPQYPHFGAYPSSYQSSYLDPYSSAEQEHTMPQASPPSSYAPSYTTSPALVGSSPALSQRAGSTERESATSYQYAPTLRSPYDTATSSAQSGYGYASGHHATSVPLQYPYQTTSDPYAGSQYSSYGQYQPGAAYLPSQTQPGGYPQQSSYTSGGSSYDPALALATEDASGVRVVTSRPKPQCWDHGCNGRQFSTFSNLLRHQREKSGTAAKSECPRCGAVFTRTTARNGHMAHDKCKRKSANSNSDTEQ